jgi:hypothetical protein
MRGQNERPLAHGRKDLRVTSFSRRRQQRPTPIGCQSTRICRRIGLVTDALFLARALENDALSQGVLTREKLKTPGVVGSTTSFTQSWKFVEPSTVMRVKFGTGNPTGCMTPVALIGSASG